MVGNHEAIASLYAQEAGNLRRHLQHKLGCQQVAEDVTQDAWLRMLTVGSDHETLRCPKAFLFTVASNLAIDSLRRGQRLQRLLPQMAPTEIFFDGDDAAAVCPRRTVEQEVDAKQRFAKVLEALAELPPKCQTAFILHKFEELSYAEVGECLGVTVSMVEKYLSRGLLHLRNRPELFED